jgi:hypothetical protein
MDAISFREIVGGVDHTTLLVAYTSPSRIRHRARE